jgi:Major Facilitator Superfamily.
MLKPYWVDRGFSPAEIGTVTTVFGIGFLIIGAIAGGAFVNRYGVHAGLLWLGILQILSNVGYALVASASAGRPALYAASIIENFTGGLGTAAFLAFLMAVCDKENAATEYALLTALYGLTRSLVGTASGFATESLGYATYFWLTVFLGVPALLLLPRIRGYGSPLPDTAHTP